DSARAPRDAAWPCSAELRRQRPGPLELVRGVQVHERNVRVAKTSDVRLGDLDDPYALEEPDDLQVPGDQPFLDVRQPRPAVGGVHGLELAADAWNHDVAAAGPGGDQPDAAGSGERQGA